LFFGNPGETLGEMDAELQALKNRMLKVQSDAKLSVAETSRLTAQQLKLRSSLSKKYSREFPQINL
jgi:hypothetical protein